MLGAVFSTNASQLLLLMHPAGSLASSTSDGEASSRWVWQSARQRAIGEGVQVRARRACSARQRFLALWSVLFQMPDACRAPVCRLAEDA